MNLHEYQAKGLFTEYGIPVPAGKSSSTAMGARRVAEELNQGHWVVKAQVHAGGRGKAGGVKRVESLNEVEAAAVAMLGRQLITHQSGPDGQPVNRVLVESACDIASELYLGLVVDRSHQRVVFMASRAGGMDIEEVAAATPEKIIKVFINPLISIQPYHCRAVAFGLHLSPAAMKLFMPMLANLYRLFVEYDCSLLEINPLVVTADEQVVALDAKLDIDSNALYRHKDILAYRDVDEEDPLEVEASKYNLNYINLSGNVGNMVNGAGLAMATMDIIKKAGAEPANFLDVGGGANAEMVENGFRIILADEN
ncbi:MAG: ADP-forming succinate--CoA ligase subunit beta, partial [Gammaproteobacteria bacterium]|nr:ADP-forming succinate--CoA ligase subunit beta [Gammaproteobacteria bacterium]